MNYIENLSLENIIYFCEFDQVCKTEEFRNIPDYEGHYVVSDLGRIKSLKCNKENILKQGLGGNGYYTVRLSKNNNKKTKPVHQLVAISFLNHKPDKQEFVVNHKNFIKSDNYKLNLEIVTNRENTNKKHCKSISKYTGVSNIKNSKKWQAKIYVNGSRIHLGSFDTEIEAHNSYENALKNLNNKKLNK